MISIIVAIAQENAIGRNNQLLCHLSDDLKRFKRLTSGHTVIMGRNTFDSLPNGPLPNRTNIVLTSRPQSLPEGCIAVKSLEEAIACAEADEELFIIGGASVYQQALPLADRRSHVHPPHLCRCRHLLSQDRLQPMAANRKRKARGKRKECLPLLVCGLRSSEISG